MRKSVLITGFIGLLSISPLVLAQDEDNGKMTITKSYETGYNQGYKKGLEDGIAEGYRQAVEYFKQIYAEKLQEYKEIEAGKILIKNWRVSYPRVYQIQTEDGSKVIVGGCKIMKEFDDLLDKIPVVSSVKKNNNNNDTDNNSISVSTEDSNKNIAISSDFNKQYVKATVSADDISKLQNTDAIYFKNTNDNTYTVYFKTKKDKDIFCSVNRCW